MFNRFCVVRGNVTIVRGRCANEDVRTVSEFKTVDEILLDDNFNTSPEEMSLCEEIAMLFRCGHETDFELSLDQYESLKIGDTGVFPFCGIIAKGHDVEEDVLDDLYWHVEGSLACEANDRDYLDFEPGELSW